MKNRILENFLYIIILCLPTYLIRFQIFSIPFTVLEILIIVLFLLFLIWHRKNINLGSYKYFILSFIIISILAVINSADLIAAAGIWKSYLIEPAMFFVVFINIKPRFNRVLISLNLVACFIAIIAIIQYFTGYGIPAPWNEPGAEYRITSVFAYPNAVGLFLTPIVALLLGNIIIIKRNVYLSVLILLISLTAIAWADTQGAFIAILGAFFFLGFYTKWKKYFIIGLIIGIFLMFTVPAINRVVTFQDNSGDVRIALWQGTWNLLMHRPWTGAGLASFPQIYEQYKLDKHTELLLYAHNIFLDFWAQLGILGLIWLLLILAKFFINGIKNANNHKIIIMAAMVSVLVYGLVDVPYFKNDLAIIFWLLLGLMEVYHKEKFI